MSQISAIPHPSLNIIFLIILKKFCNSQQYWFYHKSFLFFSQIKKFRIVKILIVLKLKYLLGFFNHQTPPPFLLDWSDDPDLTYSQLKFDIKVILKVTEWHSSASRSPFQTFQLTFGRLNGKGSSRMVLTFGGGHTRSSPGWQSPPSDLSGSVWLQREVFYWTWSTPSSSWPWNKVDTDNTV